MSVQDVAAAIANRRVGDVPWQITMIALALAESGANPNALGDYIGEPGVTLPDDAGAHCLEAYGPAGLQCYVSIGLWQINMAWNWQIVSSLAGSVDPNYVAEWLLVPVNNGYAAEAVFEQQGLGAWSTYNSGAYGAYLEAAGEIYNTYAGAFVVSQPPAPPPAPAPLPASGPSGVAPPGSPEVASSDWSPSIAAVASSVQNAGQDASGYGRAIRGLM